MICKTFIALTLVASVTAQIYSSRRCNRQGIQPMSNGACESQYIQCVAVGLEPIVFDCASSETRYDVISESCLMPEFVEACGGFSTTTTPAPQQSPTVAPFAFDCSNKRDIDFPNPNKPCSTLYVSCSGGQHFFRQCAEDNTKFDVISRKCLEDRFVKTCHGSATTIAPQEETTQAEPDTRCIGKADGVYAAESGACSPVIVTCFAERAQSLLCPEGLRFDVISEECHEPQWVAACGGRSTTTGSPLAPQANPAPADQVAFCADKADGSFPYPGECSDQFIVCVARRPIIYQCPAQLRYSKEENACLKASDVAGCTQFDAMPSNVCGGKVDGFYAHPADCHKFFYCDNQSPLELDCAGDLVFDSNHMKCDNAEKVMASSCGMIQVEDVPEFNCVGLAVGFHTNVNTCQSYYLCEENGSAWSFECQAGFAFDKSAEECRPAAQVGECMPPRLPEMTPFCKGQSRNGVFENPSDCPSGLICLQDVAFELNCMRDKPTFDRYLLQCVHTLTAEGQCAA